MPDTAPPAPPTLPTDPGPTQLQSGSGAPGGSLPFAWAEVVDDHPSTSFSAQVGGGRLTMTIQVAFNDFINFGQNGVVPALLGYALRGGGGLLTRVLPWRHPMVQHFYCTSIDGCQMLGYKGTRNDGQGPYAEYRRANLTLTFTQPPYSLSVDNPSAVDELYRYCRVLPKPYVDTLSIQNGSFVFSAGPYMGAAVPGYPSKLIPKTSIELTWFNVPDRALFGADPFLATNIDPLIGTINQAAWHSRPAGTLYLESVNYRESATAVSPVLLGIASGTVPRTWDVVFNIRRFDKGWNMLPALGSGQDGNWYAVNTAANGSGASLYTSADWTNLLKSL